MLNKSAPVRQYRGKEGHQSQLNSLSPVPVGTYTVPHGQHFVNR